MSSEIGNERGDEVADQAPATRGSSRVGRVVLAVAGGFAAAVLFIAVALVVSGRAYQAMPVRVGAEEAEPVASDQPSSRRLATLPPRGIYLVVDTARNRLSVFSGKELLREVVCSTGTGIVLRDPRNGKSWTFDTPLGERRVRNKRRDPVWTKPDWAFIEEGYLPSNNPRHRVDDVSLGDYALDLGDGYLIHGTLFQRLLGRPVTHGCIRLGDEDLEYVYRTVPFGARVYLY